MNKELDELLELESKLRALIARHERPVGDPSDTQRTVRWEDRPVPLHLLREVLDGPR